MYFYLKDTGMVFGVQLLEDHRKKGHFILVVICENRANKYLNLICLSLQFLKRVLISPFAVSLFVLIKLQTINILSKNPRPYVGKATEISC